MERTREEMGCDTDLCATNVLEHDGYLVHLLFRAPNELAEHTSNTLASSSWYQGKIPCEEWEPRLLTEYKEELLGDKKRFEEMQIMHPHKKTRSNTLSRPKWQQLEMPIIKGSQLKEGPWNTKREASKVHRTYCERHVKKAKVAAGRVAEEDATNQRTSTVHLFFGRATLNRGNTGHELAGPGCKRDVKPLDTTSGYFVLWLLGGTAAIVCFLGHGSRLGVVWTCFLERGEGWLHWRRATLLATSRGPGQQTA